MSVATLDGSPPIRVSAVLGALPVEIDGGEVLVSTAEVASYPGGLRPTSTVMLCGARDTGRGENVAWSTAAHTGFRARVARELPRGSLTLDDLRRILAERFPEPYERAAIEAAAIDLALRQNGTDLFGLLRIEPRPVRYVLSFGKLFDPAAELVPDLERSPEAELKLDAAPTWGDHVWRSLSALGRVAIIDFKQSGSVTEHERAHAALPRALIEDPLAAETPWSQSLGQRLSFDALVTGTDDLDRLPARPAAINLKPARMGGVLEAIACAERCTADRVEVYFGGMFEVGAGRLQLRELAALLSAEGPNDIAPLDIAGQRAARPARLEVVRRGSGFGIDPCGSTSR